MAIEIYDSAKIVKKGDKYYYFLKSGSKNCFVNPYQYVINNDFNNKFIKRQTRESSWNLIAIANEKEVKENSIAKTEWNAPTCEYYGQVKFGNKKNIALFFVKNKNKITDYNLLNSIQKNNIDKIINYYNEDNNKKYVIFLDDIQEKDKTKEIVEYCEEYFNIKDNYIEYNNIKFWDLDNL